MKCRVIEDKGKYTVETRMFFMWFLASGLSCYPSVFDSLEEAMAYIEYKPKVVYEGKI